MGITEKDVVLEIRSISKEKSQVIEHGRYQKLLRQYKGTDRYKGIAGSVILSKYKGVTNTTAAPYLKKGYKIMTNQEVFEMLSENETILFYADRWRCLWRFLCVL